MLRGILYRPIDGGINAEDLKLISKQIEADGEASVAKYLMENKWRVVKPDEVVNQKVILSDEQKGELVKELSRVTLSI